MVTPYWVGELGYSRIRWYIMSEEKITLIDIYVLSIRPYEHVSVEF